MSRRAISFIWRRKVAKKKPFVTRKAIPPLEAATDIVTGLPRRSKQRSGRRLGFVEALPNTDDGCVLVSYTAS